MHETSDIIVIGGGIAGISAAALLADTARVTVLEAEAQPGYHSTGRSAAVYILNYGNATLRALNAASGPVLRKPEGIADTSLLSPRGELLVATRDDIDALEAYADGATGLDRLTPDQAHQIVPMLKREALVAALYEEDALDIDVDRMLQGYLRLLKSRGGQVMTGARVVGVTRQGDDWQVTTDAGIWTAPVLVNAAGAWADQVAGLAGVRPIGLQPMRRSAVLMTVPDHIHGADRWPLFAAASETWYAKPDAGRLLISPADEDPVEPQDAWPDDMVLAEGLHRFEQVVDFPITRPTHSWAGLRSFVADRTPVAGFAPDAPGFFWLAGQGGYGVQTAPALAALACALCTGASPALPPDVVLALSPARFS